MENSNKTSFLEYENISALRVKLYDLKEKPSTILVPYEPKKYVNHAWIPQTMGDQIWVLWEFSTKEERQEWESTLPENISKWLDRTVIKYAINFGWHVRDLNGLEYKQENEFLQEWQKESDAA